MEEIRKSTISYGKQHIDDKDIEAVSAALRGDFITIGPYVDEFEMLLAEYTDTKGAVVVSSGTAALHCAYAALELRGKELITSPLTFASTATMAIWEGAKVVFADVDVFTGNIDPNHVGALISDKTAAIVPVDYAGNPCEVDRIKKITDVPLVQDSSHSLGSIYKNQKVGVHSDLTTFSFFPTKNITTAEGGAIVSNDLNLLSKARLFKMHGLVKDPVQHRYKDVGPWHQEVQTFGFNYRLSDVNCALGISQLRKIEKMKQRRKEIFEFYERQLTQLSYIILPRKTANSDPMWHLYPIRVPKEIRKELFIFLRARGIIVQVNYIPVYWHPIFQDLGYKKGMCPNAEDYYLSEISLPMHSSLKDVDLEYICESIYKFFGKISF